MAKTKPEVEELEVEDMEETDEVKAVIIRPSDLAAELEISPKALRGFLRREFPRGADQKNTSWALTQEMIDSATDHFTASDDDEEELEVEDEA